MDSLRTYVYGWNEWIVFPVLAIAATIWFLQVRRYSTFAICIGAVGLVIGDLLWTVYPPDPAKMAAGNSSWFWTLVIFRGVALTAAIGGGVWYWMADRRHVSKGI